MFIKGIDDVDAMPETPERPWFDPSGLSLGGGVIGPWEDTGNGHALREVVSVVGLPWFCANSGGFVWGAESGPAATKTDPTKEAADRALLALVFKEHAHVHGAWAAIVGHRTWTRAQYDEIMGLEFGELGEGGLLAEVGGLQADVEVDPLAEREAFWSTFKPSEDWSPLLPSEVSSIINAGQRCEDLDGWRPLSSVALGWAKRIAADLLPRHPLEEHYNVKMLREEMSPRLQWVLIEADWRFSELVKRWADERGLT